MNSNMSLDETIIVILFLFFSFIFFFYCSSSCISNAIVQFFSSNWIPKGFFFAHVCWDLFFSQKKYCCSSFHCFIIITLLNYLKIRHFKRPLPKPKPHNTQLSNHCAFFMYVINMWRCFFVLISNLYKSLQKACLFHTVLIYSTTSV